MKVHSNAALKPCQTVIPAGFSGGAMQTQPLVYYDPVDEDRQNDPVTQVTHRQLLRLVFMAAETGVRFERDKLPGDPVNWLLTPTALFSGQAPVDACRHHDAFLLGIILQGLSLGLDANPNDIAELLADEEELGDTAMPAAAVRTMRSAQLAPA